MDIAKKVPKQGSGIILVQAAFVLVPGRMEEAHSLDKRMCLGEWKR
jgi:hypothetical protein